MVLKYAINKNNQITWNIIGGVLAASVDKFDTQKVLNDYKEWYENNKENNIQKVLIEDRIYYELKHKDINHKNNELFLKLPNFSICALDDNYNFGVKKVCAVIGNSLKNHEDNYCLQLICSNDVYLLDNNGNTVEKL